jgi:hypothetical protein
MIVVLTMVSGQLTGWATSNPPSTTQEFMDSIQDKDLAGANKCVCNRLGVIFRYPKGWLVKERCDSAVASSDTIYLKPGRWLGSRDPELELEDYPVSIQLVDEDFAHALGDADLDKENDSWFITGRQGERSYAERIRGANWTGMACEQVIRIEDKSNRSTCDALVLIAVLNFSSRRSAIIRFGPAVERDAFYSLLRSFQFIRISAPQRHVKEANSALQRTESCRTRSARRSASSVGIAGR